MNWGNRIVLAFVLFASFIGYMVVRAFQENFDLVAEDYYAQEIAYQSKLNKLSNAAENEMEIKIQQTAESIILSFPEAVEGEIQFYHPSRKMFDRTFPISTLQSLNQTIDKSELVAGSYQVNISWKSDDVDYLQQTRIYIQ